MRRHPRRRTLPQILRRLPQPDLLREGREESSFFDASADGSNAFFSTNASLLPQDPGLLDIYDARSLGGFPPPPQPVPGCEGEACQSPPAPPNDPTPSSLTFNGPGNVKPPKGCPKGKHKVTKKGKASCVANKNKKAKKKSKAKKQSHKSGRAGR